MLPFPSLPFPCRWRLGSIRTYNPEQIMLSAAVRRSSRDVNIMKEKLIFSGKTLSLPTFPMELHTVSGLFRFCAHASFLLWEGHWRRRRRRRRHSPPPPFLCLLKVSPLCPGSSRRLLCVQSMAAPVGHFAHPILCLLVSPLDRTESCACDACWPVKGRGLL